MPFNSVHLVFAKRILGAAIIFSIILSSLAVFLKLRDIDNFVVQLAAQSVHNISPLLLADLQQPVVDKNSIREIMEEKKLSSTRDHFVLIELYDKHKNPIYKSVQEEKLQLILSSEEIHGHSFPTNGSSSHHRYLVDGSLYMQVNLPINSNGNMIQGYFEGIYEVPDEIVSQIKHRMIETLLLTVFVVLTTSAMLFPLVTSLNKKLVHSANKLLRGNVEMMEVLGSAIAKRDSDTSTHNYRVTLYSVYLGREMGLSSEEIKSLIAGAFLHDVGKIGVSDTILLKPGKLTSEEHTAMKSHVSVGVDILRKSEVLKCANDVVRYHHERYDGSGYLEGLKGEEIPMAARIFSVVDVFDALTSKRPYKAPYPFDKAMHIIMDGSGTLFDPRIVERFEMIAPEMYDRFAQAGQGYIEDNLDQILDKYFTL